MRSFSLSILLLAASAFTALPATVIGTWTPIFKGVDYSVSTNIPGQQSAFLYRQVAHALRVDLTDPDVHFLTTPRIEQGYIAGFREIAAYTPSEFLVKHDLQAVVNANFFSEGQYYLPAGTPMDVYGLAISEGVLVSNTDSGSYPAALMFTEENQPLMIPSNLPAASTDGYFTGIGGNAALVVNGQNVRTRNNDLDPRTAFGISQDKRYLYVVAIDGRQSGYSDGASLYETAGWMLLLGAHDAINVDGGGSTTMVVENSIGQPMRMNRSSAVADSGKERTVGSHFGIYARPVPGFINDVRVQPDDTTARISWTTIQSAVGEIRYGTSTNLGSTTGILGAAAVSHQAVLQGLTPERDYYFRIAATDGEEHLSAVLHFKTVKHVTTNRVMEVTHPWKFATPSQAGEGWAEAGYDDSSWGGPGAGLLWVDTRTSSLNPAVQPRNTEIPRNGSYPYVTYYFRTHINLEALQPGSSLIFSALIDDGAVFYLNGEFIHAVRMPDNYTAQTLATGTPCAGDADCRDEFLIPASALPSVRVGDNVLAVEVHNQNAVSRDLTFGLELSREDPIRRDVRLDASLSGSELVLTWADPSYILQSSTSPAAGWEDVQGAQSPTRVPVGGSGVFYRLRR